MYGQNQPKAKVNETCFFISTRAKVHIEPGFISLPPVNLLGHYVLIGCTIIQWSIIFQQETTIRNMAIKTSGNLYM